MATAVNLQSALAKIRSVDGFPKSGILFQDISPLLADGAAFDRVMAEFDAITTDTQMIAGIDARGFIFAAALAQRRSCGFVPIRKSGKLPWSTHTRSYGLEYGSDSLQIHVDAFEQGQKVLLIDDVLATGGTVIAAIELIQDCAATISEIAVLVEIVELGGRKRIADRFPDIQINSLKKI